MLPLLEALLAARPSAAGAAHHRHRDLGAADGRAPAAARPPPVRAARPAGRLALVPRPLAAAAGAAGRVRAVAQPDPREPPPGRAARAVNARMSARSAAPLAAAAEGSRRSCSRASSSASRRAPPTASASPRSAPRDVRTPGNLKAAAPPLAGSAARRWPSCARRSAGARSGSPPAPIPARTRSCSRRTATLRPRLPTLLTIVVPRHPERGAALAAWLRREGVAVARRSQREKPEPRHAVYLADTLGELGLFYRLARVAFVGKSLVAEGGQNPLEPARLGCPVLFGPHMTNFADIAADLLRRRRRAPGRGRRGARRRGGRAARRSCGPRRAMAERGLAVARSASRRARARRSPRWRRCSSAPSGRPMRAPEFWAQDGLARPPARPARAPLWPRRPARRLLHRRRGGRRCRRSASAT